MYAHIYIDLMGHLLQNKTDLQEDCIRYRCMTLHVLSFVSDAFGSAIRENKWINTCHLWVRLQKDYAPGPMLCSVFDLFIFLECFRHLKSLKCFLWHLFAPWLWEDFSVCYFCLYIFTTHHQVLVVCTLITQQWRNIFDGNMNGTVRIFVTASRWTQVNDSVDRVTSLTFLFTGKKSYQTFINSLLWRRCFCYRWFPICSPPKETLHPAGVNEPLFCGVFLGPQNSHFRGVRIVRVLWGVKLSIAQTSVPAMLPDDSFAELFNTDHDLERYLIWKSMHLEN